MYSDILEDVSFWCIVKRMNHHARVVYRIMYRDRYITVSVTSPLHHRYITFLQVFDVLSNSVMFCLVVIMVVAYEVGVRVSVRRC